MHNYNWLNVPSIVLNKSNSVSLIHSTCVFLKIYIGRSAPSRVKIYIYIRVDVCCWALFPPAESVCWTPHKGSPKGGPPLERYARRRYRAGRKKKKKEIYTTTTYIYTQILEARKGANRCAALLSSSALYFFHFYYIPVRVSLMGCSLSS